MPKPKKYVSDIPELMAEWDWEKNNELGLDPKKLTYGSEKKAHWICNKGHMWIARINSRCGTQGNNCPYCSNYKAWAGDNDLNTTHPQLAKEWHPINNGTLKPTDIVRGSCKKVWWKCSKCGYEYETRVCDKTYGRCPYCSTSRHRVHLGINDLATMYPHIAKEWHPTKNGNLQATDVSYSSTKKVWWQCEHGHEWQAVIQERTRKDRGSTCPYCSHHGMSYKELTVLYYLQKYANCEVLHRCKLFGFEFDIHIPSLKVCIEYDGAYYHKDRQNRDLQKNKITNDNQIMLYRIRENPLTSLNSTSHDLLYNPQNINELSHVITYLIKTLFDKNVTIDINQEQNELSKFNKMTQVKNSLAITHPELVQEWHPTKNTLSPYQVTAGSGKKAWWQCKNGHEWEARISSRIATSYSKGNNCPYCSNHKLLIGYNDLATTHPHLVKEWHPTKNGTLKPTDVFAGNPRNKVWWKCHKCGYEWKASTYERAYSNTKCTACSCNRQAPTTRNTLSLVHPELIEEWHPTRNGNITPDNITYGSAKKVWWKCSICGHEWQTKVCARSHGTGCPMCYQRTIQSKNNYKTQ